MDRSLSVGASSPIGAGLECQEGRHQMSGKVDGRVVAMKEGVPIEGMQAGMADELPFSERLKILPLQGVASEIQILETLISQYEKYFDEPAQKGCYQEALNTLHLANRRLSTLFEDMKKNGEWREEHKTELESLWDEIQEWPSGDSFQETDSDESKRLDMSLPFARLYVDKMIHEKTQHWTLSETEGYILHKIFSKDEERTKAIIGYLMDFPRCGNIKDALSIKSIGLFAKCHVIAILMGEHKEEDVKKIIPSEWLKEDHLALFRKIDFNQSMNDFFSEINGRISKSLSNDESVNQLCELYSSVSQMFVARYESCYRDRKWVLEQQKNRNILEIMQRLVVRIVEKVYDRNKKDNLEEARNQAWTHILKRFVYENSVYLTQEEKDRYRGFFSHRTHMMISAVNKAPRFALMFDSTPWLKNAFPRPLVNQIQFYWCLLGYRGISLHNQGVEISNFLADYSRVVKNCPCVPVVRGRRASLALRSDGLVSTDFYKTPENVFCTSLDKGCVVLCFPKSGHQVIVTSGQGIGLVSSCKEIIKNNGLDSEGLRAVYFPGEDSYTRSLSELKRISKWLQEENVSVVVSDENLSISKMTVRKCFNYEQELIFNRIINPCSMLFVNLEDGLVCMLPERSSLECSNNIVLYSPQKCVVDSGLIDKGFLGAMCMVLNTLFDLLTPDPAPNKRSDLAKALQIPCVEKMKNLLNKVDSSMKMSVKNRDFDAVNATELSQLLSNLAKCTGFVYTELALRGPEASYATAIHKGEDFKLMNHLVDVFNFLDECVSRETLASIKGLKPTKPEPDNMQGSKRSNPAIGSSSSQGRKRGRYDSDSEDFSTDESDTSDGESFDSSTDSDSSEMQE